MTFQSICNASLFTGLLIATATPGLAQEYNEYPAATGFPFPRSYLTGRAICIPPYDRAFRVRVYTTPPQPPYYNIPPYAVISAY